MSDLQEPSQPEFCTMCSEEIEGDPYAEFTVIWRNLGMEFQTVCSIACVRAAMEMWSESLDREEKRDA